MVICGYLIYQSMIGILRTNPIYGLFCDQYDPRANSFSDCHWKVCIRRYKYSLVQHPLMSSHWYKRDTEILLSSVATGRR